VLEKVIGVKPVETVWPPCWITVYIPERALPSEYCEMTLIDEPVEVPLQPP